MCEQRMARLVGSSGSTRENHALIGCLQYRSSVVRKEMESNAASAAVTKGRSNWSDQVQRGNYSH